MLFDADTQWVKRLARDVGLGKRDVTIRSVKLGPEHVTSITAKSDDGLEFLKEMKRKLPRVEVDPYEYEDDEDLDDEDDEAASDEEE